MKHILLMIAVVADSLLAVETQNPNRLSPEEIKAGFHLLFNGVNLDGWKAQSEKNFRVKDGRIIADGTKGRSTMYYVGPKGEASFVNYELRLQVLTRKGANSGIYFRTKWQKSGYPDKFGYEAQIANTHKNRFKTGSIQKIRNITKSPVKDDEWFDYHIIVEGKKITLKINGQTTVEFTEQEPNNAPGTAMVIQIPAKISGVILDGADLFRFRAKAGEQWVLEINAARGKSPLDSKVEVLDATGAPIERVRLQAVRKSWLTFRGKDSSTSGDFRVFKWREMTLNQFLYLNGEVVKLWHYPRGPDSGYMVYPGSGSRYGYHDTTPLAHPLGQPAYIVEPLAKGTAPTANGLPTFTIYHQNDDESRRRFGKDSKLTFTAPADGDYLVRVSDVRGFQGEDFKYTMTIRPRRPDFKLTIGGFADGVPKGSGREFNVKAERLDDFEGPIRIDITDVPEGFHVTAPLTIEAGQLMAFGAIYTGTDTAMPENDFAIVTATATINGKEVTHDIGKLGNIKPIDKPKLLVQVTTNESGAARTGTTSDPLEFNIAPGETISARVRVERNGFNSRVELGSHDAGRNLPHGVYVDNIGLNGLLIVEGQTEREFFITADDWVPETTKHFHIRTTAEKGIVSNPLILHVQKK